MFTDTHSHILPPEYSRELLRQADMAPGLEAAKHMLTERIPTHYPEFCGKALSAGTAGRVAALDGGSIDRQILSAGAFVAYKRDTSAAVRSLLVRLWNEETASVAAGATDRLAMFASLPLPDVEAAVAEASRVAGQAGVVGYCLTTHIGGVPLDDPAWLPLFHLLDEMGATVFVHPDRFCVPDIMPRHLETDLGTQFDDALATVRLYETVSPRFPRIRWIMAHLGGGIPFLLGRLDEHWERDRSWRALDRAPSESLGAFLFDSAGHDHYAIEFAVRRLGHSKVVFGTDYPMIAEDGIGAAKESVRVATSSPAAFDQVAGGNLDYLFSP